MRKCRLPSREQCFEILRDCCVPEHIIKHCVVSAKLGVFFADRLNEKGIAVDTELVERACLLHDVLRICEVHDFSQVKWHASDEHSSRRPCSAEGYAGSESAKPEPDKAKWQQLKVRYKGLRHEDAACRLLVDEYPELAQVIRKHRYAGILSEQDKPRTWEEKIVYYADKRVMHDKIVPLKERLEEAHKRSAAQRDPTDQNVLDVKRIDTLIFELEREIFVKVGLEPDKVQDEMMDSFSGSTVQPSSGPSGAGLNDGDGLRRSRQ